MASIVLDLRRIFVQVGIYGIKFKEVDTMKRQLFQGNTVCKQGESVEKCNDLEKLIEIQAVALATTYHATCFDVKQLQDIFGVCETNVYRLLRSGELPSRMIGRRKVVPVAALAQFLVMSEKNS